MRKIYQHTIFVQIFNHRISEHLVVKMLAMCQRRAHCLEFYKKTVQAQFFLLRPDYLSGRHFLYAGLYILMKIKQV